MIISRRQLISMTPALLGMPLIARAAVPFRFGLTPVFLDNDAAVIVAVELTERQRPVER